MCCSDLFFRSVSFYLVVKYMLCLNCGKSPVFNDHGYHSCPICGREYDKRGKRLISEKRRSKILLETSILKQPKCRIYSHIKTKVLT